MVLVMSVGLGGRGGRLSRTRWQRRVDLGSAERRSSREMGNYQGGRRGGWQAGCDVLVASSAIFERARSERGGVIRRLQGA